MSDGRLPYASKVELAADKCLRALHERDEAAFQETTRDAALPASDPDDESGLEGFANCLQAFLGDAVPTDDHNPLNDIDFAKLARQECQLHALRLFDALRKDDVDSAHAMAEEVLTGLVYWMSKREGTAVSPGMMEAMLETAAAMRGGDTYWLGFFAVCGCEFFHRQGDDVRARKWLDMWADRDYSTAKMSRDAWRSVLDQPPRDATS